MTRTLVLDVGYQPHRIVSWQRAVLMLFQSKAEPVEVYEEIIYDSDTFVMKMPAVIRLLNKVSRKKAVRFSRMNVLTRDKWTCQYCGKRFKTRKLNYDHVTPRSQGGKTVWENIVTSCYLCNAKKGGRTPDQAGMKLLNVPYKPKSLPVVSFHIEESDSIPGVWRNFLYWHGKLQSDDA